MLFFFFLCKVTLCRRRMCACTTNLFIRSGIVLILIICKSFGVLFFASSSQLFVLSSYCPSAHHVLSTHKHVEGEEEQALPQRLSLLLPTDVFNGTMEAFRAGGAPMVEVRACSLFFCFLFELMGVCLFYFRLLALFSTSFLSFSILRRRTI